MKHDTALVTISDLSKQFENANIPAISDLTSQIKPGRVTGLVGPDGAGKTTLLRLYAPALWPL